MATKKPTKAELEQIKIQRKQLAETKDEVFKEVCEDAYNEHKQFGNCEECKFLSTTCHKGCGIIMKWLHKSGKVETTHTYGNVNRIVSESEHSDLTGHLDGVADEVDRYFSSSNPKPEISEEELAEYIEGVDEVDED